MRPQGLGAGPGPTLRVHLSATWPIGYSWLAQQVKTFPAVLNSIRRGAVARRFDYVALTSSSSPHRKHTKVLDSTRRRPGSKVPSPQGEHVEDPSIHESNGADTSTPGPSCWFNTVSTAPTDRTPAPQLVSAAPEQPTRASSRRRRRTRPEGTRGRPRRAHRRRAVVLGPGPQVREIVRRPWLRPWPPAWVLRPPAGTGVDPRLLLVQMPSEAASLPLHVARFSPSAAVASSSLASSAVTAREVGDALPEEREVLRLAHAVDCRVEAEPVGQRQKASNSCQFTVIRQYVSPR